MDNYETIDGRSVAVIFTNEENGYTVMKLDCGDGTVVTAVGCIPFAAAGEDFSLAGAWVSHPVYGQQFKVESFERCLPTDEEGIRLFLASGLLHGVGEATAERIVERFGIGTFDVLAESPEKLSGVKGITEKRARELGASFSQQMDIRRLMEFLTPYHIRPMVALRLYQRLGPLAQDALTRNPYLLMDEYYGVDFAQADGFAKELGFTDEAPERIEAGLKYVLLYNEQKGHVFIPYPKLQAAGKNLLGPDSGEQIDEAVGRMAGSGDMVREDICGEDACYLASMYETENDVAERIAALVQRQDGRLSDAESLIDEAERELGITYAARQREAVAAAAVHSLMILTGGPGTGKTTAVRGVLWMFGKMGLRVELAAPTGRAAKRMSELCGMEAKTLHRLLETEYSDDDRSRSRFARNEENPLDADAVIVDELSMVDLSLMRALLCALRPDAKLIMVGDADQLPSVGPGNLLRDLVQCGLVSTVHLDEIFRQARESMIVTNAHEINQGRMPPLRGGRDFFFMRRPGTAETVDTVVELCRSRLPAYYHMDSAQIQVISPSRIGDAGTYALNRSLQAALNPPDAGKPECRRGETVFREGDRVMQVRNNYDITWRRADGGEAGLGIFNGDIGVIERIDSKTELMTIRFDDRLADYNDELLGELELAYAITAHKSQGSEFPAVVFVAQCASRRLMSRNLLYTAVTRAKKLLVIVGDEEVLQAMVSNNLQHKRYTALRTRLRRLLREVSP